MKLLKCFICGICIAMLLSSCNLKTEESIKIESSTIDSLSKIATNDSISESQIDDIEDEYYNSAIIFLDSLKNCYNNYFLHSTGIWDYAYSQLQGVKIDSYTIDFQSELYIEAPDNSKSRSGSSFSVELDISESFCEQFPVGKSNWILDIAYEEGGCATFYPVGKTLTRIWYDEDNILPVTELCYRFSTFMHCYATMNDFNELVPDTGNTRDFNNFCINSARFAGAGYVKNMQDYFKTTLGINHIDYTKCSIYDKETNQLREQTGAIWTYPNIILQEYDKNTKEYIIEIEYYADSTYLFVAKTMRYIAIENPDGSYRIKETQLLVDNHYTPAHGSV